MEQTELFQFDSSKESIKAIGETLKGELRRKIWRVLRKADMSAREICEYTGLPWQTVTPRLTELKDKGAIEVIKFKVDPVSKRQVSVYRAREA